MPSQWYYVVNGQQGGPITSPKLKHLAITGRLSPDDLVWRDGMEDWEPASTLKGLFDQPDSVEPELTTTASRPDRAPRTPKLAQAPKPTIRSSSSSSFDNETSESPKRRKRKSESDVEQEQYASFWRRFRATLIDGVLLLLTTWFFSFVLNELIQGDVIQLPNDRAQNIIERLFNILLRWLYFAGMESSAAQATFGKQAVGIRVADLNGDRISFARATGRYFAKLLNLLTLLVGYLMPLWTARRQALHDFVAGCVILRDKS